ncbi:CmcJ/NvfI family oxidoreductase [Dyella silvatica]|uniref:CmcJ/NvfI family oxidoreductase n=1 Tax=Dyella silvatica TaxID=2992128 RepID=UPI0022567FFF|nr:CmcJ/NvfI family oxidoreductase [Dyella silvatica]
MTLDPLLREPSRLISRRYAPVMQNLPYTLAKLSYLQPTHERPLQYAYQPPPGTPWESCPFDERDMRIADARQLTTRTTVHREGFELWHAPTALSDFSDRDSIVQRYYPEVVELACAATGARRGYVFDHLIRQREGDRRRLNFGRSAQGQVAAANGRIHNDYTEASGRRRLGLVLEAVGEHACSVGRYSIVNVWRSIRHPVLDTPLAVCDARSLSATDLIEAEVRYPRRHGEIYLAIHSSRHRWFYFSAMHRDEALVFKQYDAQLGGVARYTPHAAFDHPDAPDGWPARESIEARCLVIYE